MIKEIAVFVNEAEHTTSLYEPGKIMVFHKEAGCWQVDRTADFILQPDGVKELRDQVATVLALLGECKIFVTKSITGVAYFELEKKQVSVWEISGKPENFLDDVWAREEENKRRSPHQENIQPPPLMEIFPGCFRISLTEIQTNSTGLTTKQVLMPVLNKGNFYSLEILCNHLPPWLELELEGGKYTANTERISKEEIKVLVIPKDCHDANCWV
ncbi:MAG: Fe-only nitrogenase accessory AnfO family protein [Syntrophomonas sp.]